MWWVKNLSMCLVTIRLSMLKITWSCNTQEDYTQFLNWHVYVAQSYEKKEYKFAIWLAFTVEYLMTEGARYPSPHCPDHLSGNPLFTLLLHKIKIPVWFIDKVRTEPVVPRVWSIPWPLPLVLLVPKQLHFPCSSFNLWEQNRLRNSWYRRPAVWFCQL